MMHRLIHLAIAAQVLCLPASALITLSRDTTWGPDTVNIADNVMISNGVTLTVAPGSHLIFDDERDLQVQGRILAMGTPADSIRFTVPEGSSNTWNGIRFIKTPWTNDTSKLAYCVVEWCGTNYFNPGAVAIDSFSKVVIAHAVIRNNGGSGSFDGGGLRLRKADPVIINSMFINNSADGSMSHGGAIYCLASNPVIVNTLFYGNSSSGASAGGAAMYLSMSSPTIVNCTFVKNDASGAASFGGGIYCNYRSSPLVVNTIIWGNLNDQIPLFDTSCAPVFRNCAIQSGSYKAAGSRAVFDQCIALNPLFIDSTGNFFLRAGSPCINSGSTDTTGLKLPSVDLGDGPRIASSRIDMGAYEFQGAVGLARETAVVRGAKTAVTTATVDLRGRVVTEKKGNSMVGIATKRYFFFGN